MRWVWRAPRSVIERAGRATPRILGHVFTTRQASISDALVIGDLLVRSAKFAYAEIASPEYLAALDATARASEYEGLLPQQRDGHYAVILALENDLPLGFAEIELAKDQKTGTIGVLQRMFFVPESLGRGLGPVLHGAVIETLARWGCSEVELTFVKGNDRAWTFYRKQGWTETGEIRPFDDHGRTLYDVVMRRPVP